MLFHFLRISNRNLHLPNPCLLMFDIIVLDLILIWSNSFAPVALDGPLARVPLHVMFYDLLRLLLTEGKLKTVCEKRMLLNM
jgi:hypothetical protein